MTHGWTKSAVVDLADVSIIETCRRVGFGINKPQYQNDTRFHQACPFTKVSLIRINCRSEVRA